MNLRLRATGRDARSLNRSPSTLCVLGLAAVLAGPLAALPVPALAAPETIQRLFAREGGAGAGDVNMDYSVSLTTPPTPPEQVYSNVSYGSNGVYTAVLLHSLLTQKVDGLFAGVVAGDQIYPDLPCVSACSVNSTPWVVGSQTSWSDLIVNDTADSRQYTLSFDLRMKVQTRTLNGAWARARAETIYIVGDLSTGLVALGSFTLSARSQAGGSFATQIGQADAARFPCSIGDTGPTPNTNGYQHADCETANHWTTVALDLGVLDPGESLPVFISTNASGSWSGATYDLQALAREDVAGRVGFAENFTYVANTVRNIQWTGEAKDGSRVIVAGGIPPAPGAVPLPSAAALVLLALALLPRARRQGAGRPGPHYCGGRVS